MAGSFHSQWGILGKAFPKLDRAVMFSQRVAVQVWVPTLPLGSPFGVLMCHGLCFLGVTLSSQ